MPKPDSIVRKYNWWERLRNHPKIAEQMRVIAALEKKARSNINWQAFTQPHPVVIAGDKRVDTERMAMCRVTAGQTMMPTSSGYAPVDCLVLSSDQTGTWIADEYPDQFDTELEPISGDEPGETTKPE